MKSVELSEQAIINADVNGDGKVNIVDATYIARYSVHAITQFPVESA